MILLSELSRRRIRSINKLIRVGKQEVRAAARRGRPGAGGRQAGRRPLGAAAGGGLARRSVAARRHCWLAGRLPGLLPDVLDGSVRVGWMDGWMEAEARRACSRDGGQRQGATDSRWIGLRRTDADEQLASLVGQPRAGCAAGAGPSHWLPAASCQLRAASCQPPVFPPLGRSSGTCAAPACSRERSRQQTAAAGGWLAGWPAGRQAGRSTEGSRSSRGRAQGSPARRGERGTQSGR
jgi:hypothetical protein